MKRQPQSRILTTTLEELSAAYFEAALAELGDEETAARVATRLVMDAVRTGRFGVH